MLTVGFFPSDIGVPLVDLILHAKRFAGLTHPHRNQFPLLRYSSEQDDGKNDHEQFDKSLHISVSLSQSSVANKRLFLFSLPAINIGSVS
jgi:hypothetical protein